MRGDNVLQWVKANDLLYWRIVDKNTGNPVARFDNENDTSNSLELLTQNLSFLRDGKYSIFARKNYKGTNGELEFPFTIGEPKHEIAGIGSSNEIGYIMQIADLKRQLDIKDMQHKMELLKLKQQNEESKPDLLDRVTQIFGMIKDLDTSKKVEPAVAGLPEQEALAKNLEELSKYLSIEEMLTLTKKLADLLKLSPDAVKTELKKNNLL
jgi:hypothetical protein